jgi:hypothetical protein
MIAATLAHLRLECTRDPERVEFTDHDLDDLWQRWLRPFAGTGEGDGWLDQLDDASLSLTKERLLEWLPEAVAALCWLSVQPGSGHRERVVAFQPVLAATFAHNLIEPTNMTARYLSAVTGRTVTPAEVDSQLLNAIEYIDDALWCSRTAEELHLEDLNFQARPGAPSVQVRLDVRGVTNPHLDPRIPRLVVLVRRYRRCDGVALFAADGSWRLSFATCETIACRPDRDASMIESTIPLAAASLSPLPARQVYWPTSSLLLSRWRDFHTVRVIDPPSAWCRSCLLAADHPEVIPLRRLACDLIEIACQNVGGSSSR